MQFSRDSVKSSAAKNVLSTFCLLWIFFLLTPFAHAFNNLWEDESQKFVTGITPDFDSCSGCHTPIKNNDLKIKTPIEVPIGLNEADLILEGFNVDNEDWSSLRYQVDSKDSVLLNDVRPGGTDDSIEIDITDLGSPVQLRYCLMDANVAETKVDNTRTWNCQEVEITREKKPPTTPDVIAIPGPVEPGGPILTGPTLPPEALDPQISFDDEVDNPLRINSGIERSIPFKVLDNNPTTVQFMTSSSDTSVATASVMEGATEAGTSKSGTLVIDAKREGSATIVLTVINSLDREDSLSINVAVSRVNTAPEAKQNSYIVSADDRVRSLDVLDNDFDPENDNLSIALNNNVSALGNSISVAGGKVTYELTAALMAIDTFSYRAEDADGLQSNEVTVTLTPSDEDADNIIDAVDNCPILANTDQGNMDSDSFGDVCDDDPDGDGIPGISGAPFESGKELVDEKCLTCHLTGTSGAPKFGDDADWDARIAAAGGDPANLLDSVVNGKPPLMPAFGDQESHERLLQAILYLSGREVIPDGESGGPDVVEPDVDSDSIPDALDNCPTVPNPDQLNSDSTPAGDACEPLADRDDDGFPFSIDDDDGNANRLIATLPVVTNSTVFSSSGNLKLGRVADAVAQSVGYTQAAIVMSDEAFSQGVTQVFPGVTVQSDTSFSSLMGIIDIVATSSEGTSELIIHLSSNLPLEPTMRIFDSGNGLWSNFQLGDAGQLHSAPATNSGCPNRESANYQSGLIAGLSCVRVKFQDGGLNDADGSANNRAELVANIAGGTSIGDGTPATVDTSPSKSSGGAASPWLLLLLLSFTTSCTGLTQRQRG